MVLGSDDFVFEGSDRRSVKGLNPAACIELLQTSNLSSDAFFLSPDETTTNHHREGLLMYFVE